MKACEDLAVSATVELRNALVYVDDYHRRAMGLAFVGDSCTMADGQQSRNGRHIAVVSSVPEQIADRAEDADQASLFTFVLPADQVHAVEPLLSIPALATQSVRTIASDGHVLMVSVVRASATDVAIAPLFAGLRIAAVILRHSRPPADLNAESELRGKLMSALELLQATSTLEASEPQNGDSHSIALLERRLIKTSRERDALQRKYDSLANSVLGRLTLKRWERNRGRKR